MVKLKYLLVGLLKEMEATVVGLIKLLASEKGYSALFKAGIVLVSASMLAISQAGAIVYDSDINSHRNKFEIEVVLKEELKNATQCFSLPPAHIAKCRSAIYELSQVQSAWELSLQIFRMCLHLGVALLTAATIGFVASLSKPAAEA